MRALILGLAAAGFATAAWAQITPLPADRTFVSAAELMAMVDKAKSETKPGTPTVAQRLLQLPPYGSNLEYRTETGPAQVHEHDAELFFVLDGSGVLVTGGKLVNEKRTNAANLSGTAIDGGISRTVGKGDTFIVPENTPHQFMPNGRLVLMSLHVPRPPSAPWP